MSLLQYSKVIILGSGPAGYTASIYASRANLNPILLTGYNTGGQLTKTNEIENWPGEKDIITGAELMQKMHKHSQKLHTKIISDSIIKVNFKTQPFYMKGEKYEYQSNAVIIATGSNPRYLGLKSENFFKGKGVSTCAVCDGFFYKNQEVAVVGGGNTAVEETLYLSQLVKKVHLIHRKNTFKAEKILINRLKNKIKNHKIQLYLDATVKEILGNDTGVTGIQIQQKYKKTMKDINITLSGIFIAIGYTPNTNIFKNTLDMNNGYIKILHGEHKNYTQTSIPGIFAAGDVTDHVYKQAITSSASGCMAALDCEHYLNNIF